MSRSLSNLRRGLLGIAVLGALGFGASQALAAPPKLSQARWCNEYCYTMCQEMGGLNAYCTYLGDCYCY